jgi:hypothetical protein
VYLPIDSNYYVYDIEQLFEEPVQGIFDGSSITIPMDQDSTEVTQPLEDRYSNDVDASTGTNALEDIKHTSYEFGVYIVKADEFIRGSTLLVVENCQKLVSNVKVYPNPASTLLFITANDLIEKVDLLNTTGKVTRTQLLRIILHYLPGQ